MQKLKAKDVGIFIGNQNHKASVRASRNPQKNGSFGFVGTFATVEAKATFIDGILVLRFNPKKLGLVNRESLRIFPWDEKAKQFFKVPGSSVGLEGDYVYARISRTGRYSIIGINTYPTVLQTIKAFYEMRGVLKDVPPKLARAIRDRLCKVLLCDSGVARAMRDSRLVRELAREGANDGFPMPSGDPGELPGDSPLCDFCFGAPDSIPPPEGEILEEMEPGCSDTGWESVGPDNMSGCIRQVVLDPNNSNRLYAAADDGGVWVLDRIDYYPFRTMTWRPLTDQEDDLRMRAIAIAPSDSRIIYYANSLGYLHKSTDQGVSWHRTSSTNLGDNVSKILIHLEDPLTVVVATRSGLYQSSDGGASWPYSWRAGEEILDAVMDPQDTSIIYIAVRNVGVLKNHGLGFSSWIQVLSWAARSPDPGGGGTSMIKIALGYRNADGSFQTDLNRRVVVKLGREIWVNDSGGRGSWTPKGRIWTNLDGSQDTGQGDWDHCVAIDPFDPNVILFGHENLRRTADGGNTWSYVAGWGEWAGDILSKQTHEDQHSIEFDRRNRGVVYSSNDGGVFRSVDGGVTWAAPHRIVQNDVTLLANIADEIAAKRNLNLGLVTAQFYRLGVHGNYAVGNAYHLGIISSPSLSSKKWRGIQGGTWEFDNVYADPKRPSRYYVLAPRLARQRYPPSVILETGGSDFYWYTEGDLTPYRSATAVSPIAVDTRRDSQNILFSAEDNPPSSLGYSLMFTRDGDIEPFENTATPPELINLPSWNVATVTGSDPIVSVVFAQSTPGKAYAITLGGQVFTREDVNARGVWPPRVGRWSTDGVRQLAVNSENDHLLYAITGNLLARSVDGGVTWQDSDDLRVPPLGVGLPPSEFNSIVTHPRDPFKLFLGADNGVYISDDGGDNWDRYDDRLPNSEVTYIFWQNHYLYMR